MTKALGERWLRPFVVTRYLAIDAILEQVQPSWILEIGAGLSPRGLIWGAMKGTVYFEADLPSVVTFKRKLLKHITSNIHNNGAGNVALLHLDVTQPDQWTQLFSVLPKTTGKGVVVTEGLLQYMNRDQVSMIGRQIATVLQKTGGYWVSTDFPTRSYYDLLFKRYPRLKEINAMRTETTGVDISANCYKSDEDTKIFLELNGWIVDRRQQMTLVKAKISRPPKDFESHLGLYVLEPRHGEEVVPILQA
jgi:O-methyltransferase involved in polyketide biosynthesis